MIAKNYGISKDDLDRYAFESHRRAIAATREGAFNDEIVPVEIRQADGSATERCTPSTKASASMPRSKASPA